MLVSRMISFKFSEHKITYVISSEHNLPLYKQISWGSLLAIMVYQYGVRSAYNVDYKSDASC